MNKGSIQTTVSRLLKNKDSDRQQQKALGSTPQNTVGFVQYRVNNYDFSKQDEMKKIVTQKYGVEKIPSSSFFDGTTSEDDLVKIAPHNRALSAKDIEEILQELQAHPDEARNILLVGYGNESSLWERVAKHNRPPAINIITILDMQKDHLYKSSPAQAHVTFQTQGELVNIAVENFVSPTILQQLGKDRSQFLEEIGDFKAKIDRILIDNDYDGKTFRITESDIPEKKTDFVKGTYPVKKPHAKAVIAVKIIDMLGEETLVFSTPKNSS